MFKYAKLRKEMGSLGIEPILGCVRPGTSLKALISFTISTTVKMSESSLLLKFDDSVQKWFSW